MRKKNKTTSAERLIDFGSENTPWQVQNYEASLDSSSNILLIAFFAPFLAIVPGLLTVPFQGITVFFWISLAISLTAMVAILFVWKASLKSMNKSLDAASRSLYKLAIDNAGQLLGKGETIKPRLGESGFEFGKNVLFYGEGTLIIENSPAGDNTLTLRKVNRRYVLSRGIV